MYKKVFFKVLALFLLTFLFLGSTISLALNPSYLFLERNQIDTTEVDMLLLVTPEKDFDAGSALTIFFPVNQDEQWCKSNDISLSAQGVSSSKINTEGWQIDSALPGSLTAKCYQGTGPDSHDRVVISDIDALYANVSYAVKISGNVNLSTGSVGGSNNIVVQLARGIISESVAYAIYLQSPDGVDVTAFISDDPFSDVRFTPTTVEKGVWSTARVRVMDSKGNPLAGRTVNLNFEKPSSLGLEVQNSSGTTNSNGVFQTQVRSFDSGIVKVTAVDKTFSKDVEIQDFANLTITNVPTVTLHSINMYNIEQSQKISWNSLGSGYQYYVEASLSSNFNTIEKNSGWISSSSHTFQNLSHGKAYYYRAKVRNVANAESSYSNVVSSVQAAKPTGNIEVLDSVVERGRPARVSVRVVDSNGNPMANREVELRIDSGSNNWSIQQPSKTGSDGYTQGIVIGQNVGTVKVTAVDVTATDEYYIPGHDWLQVVQVPSPSLHSLPNYSRGTSRRLTWNALSGNYQYLVQASRNSNFSDAQSSGWINENEYRFTNLQHGQGYFYRVKARNVAKKESSYSNVVSSIQDSRGPQIEKTDFEIIRKGEEDEEKVEMVRFTFKTSSLSGVSVVDFTCKNSETCGSKTTVNSFHYVVFEKEELNQYFTQNGGYIIDYCFKARDIVGNNNEFCDVKEFTFVEEEEEIIEDEVIDDDEEIVVVEEEEENIISRATAPIREGFNVVRDRTRESVETAVVFVQDLEIDDARVQTTSVVMASAAAPITIFSVVFNPANYQYAAHLFIGFVGLFRRKKKFRPYGYVYDAVTKEPINKAVVRIFKGSKLITTTVSNVYGAFNADLKPGKYHLEVIAENYSYPSKLITGSVDTPLENIYRGGKFLVEEESQIKYSIPLDPVASSTISNFKTVLVTNLKKAFVAFQKVLVVVGLFVALFMYIRNPSTFNLAIFTLYMPLLFIHMIFALSNKKYSFGTVRDMNGNILKGVVLGLREMEFEKLIAKRVTNERGRYKFLVPGGKYKLEVLSSEYEIKSPPEKHLNFKGSVKKPLLVNKNIVLDKKS